MEIDIPRRDFRNNLSLISQDLRSDDTDALKFLLVGTLPKPYLTRKVGPLEIFEALEERNHLNESTPWLLIQCLKTIDRVDLAERFFQGNEDRMPSFPSDKISQFRLTLFFIGMDLGEKDKDDLIHLFKDNIFKKTRENIKTSFDLLVYLEEKRIFCESNTESLQNALITINRIDLARNLKKFHSDIRKGSSRGSNNDSTTLNGRRGSFLVTLDARLMNSVIKGCHSYGVTPPLTNPPIRFNVRTEPENTSNACVVRVPYLENISASMNNADCYRGIAGKVVGHVPGGLSKSFRFILEMGCTVFAEPISDKCPSFPPWPSRFQRGGGMVIPCDYIMSCPNEDMLQKAKQVIENALARMPERSAMTLC